jgi:AcrR family transcriptional regulator
MSGRKNSYDVIVDAAEAVVIETGSSHMTLDAVAAKAGISKGGLLHHFPTKDVLLEAMLARQLKVRIKSREMVCRELPDGPTRAVKGHVLSVLFRDQSTDRIGASLLAVLAHNPKLIEPGRESIRKLYAGFTSSGMKFERAAIIALAADGLWLQETLSISPFSEEQRKKIIDELFRLLDEQKE